MRAPNAIFVSDRRRQTVLADVPESDWLTEKEAARECNLVPKTMRNWRAMNPPRGPAFHRLGRKIRYARSDIDAWVKRNRVEPA
jgi:predicted DNA-binding transcriptional regulator AlpA